jgi:hypothetical protein
VILDVERDERGTTILVRGLSGEDADRELRQIENYARAIIRRVNSRRDGWRIEED